MTVPPEPQTLDAASDALQGSDPQSLHRSGRAFNAVSQQLRKVSDEFRAELRTLENAWQGPGAQAFAGTATQLTRHVNELAEGLSSPGYGYLCGELADALDTAQRRVQQLRQERDEQRGAPTPQQGAPQDQAAQQVMTGLANTYRQIGNQFPPLSKQDTQLAGAREVARPVTGTAHEQAASAADNISPHSTHGASSQAGTVLPAGGALGKAPKSSLAQDSGGIHGESAQHGTLGRPGAGHAAGGHAAGEQGSLAGFALAGGTLGRRAAEHRTSSAPTQHMTSEESRRTAVLGSKSKKNACEDHTAQPGGSEDGTHQHPHKHESEKDSHDRSDEHSAQPATQTSGDVTELAASGSTPTPPSTTSAPLAAAHDSGQQAIPAEAPKYVPQPEHVVAHAQAAESHAAASPAAASPATVSPAAASPAAVSPAAVSPAGASPAHTPLPGGVPNTGDVASPAGNSTAQPAIPPHPNTAPAAGQQALTAQNHPGDGHPPAGGAGAGSAVNIGDERERNTLLSEGTDTWQHASHSGVLGR